MVPGTAQNSFASRCLFVTLSVLAVVGLAKEADAQEGGPERAGRTSLLTLVTEKVQRPDDKKATTHYWWSNPTKPQWTGTDRALKEALESTSARALTPPGDIRISRIYRTPDLSIDNAAALASILGARRIVFGEVVYRPTPSKVLSGKTRVQVDGAVQIVDVSSSEPSVLRTVKVHRSLYVDRDREEGGDGPNSALDQARKGFAAVAGRLIGRSVAASSGPVGIDSAEHLLAFRDLERGRALDLVGSFLSELKRVEATRVRWASEGVVTLEVNPGQQDPWETVDYAARALASHKFDRMTLKRRSGEKGADPLVEFDVELADDFGEKRPSSEKQENDE